MKNTDWLKNGSAPYAHRGLHDNETVPENSMAAFRRAIDAGYGIELDVYLTNGGKLIVHHDPTLRRTCNLDLAAEAVDADDLQRYRLMNTDETIPLFGDVLRAVDGKIDLIVEIKTTTRVDATCRAVYDALKDYRGNYAVESFQPQIVRWWAQNHPETVLGQLYSERALVRRLTGATRTHPLIDFFAINVADMQSRFVARYRAQYPDKAVIAWTVRTARQQETARRVCDNYIFECNLKDASYIRPPALTK